ncbi:MAG: transcriptional regulator [Planctomycetota bacterium]|jgi:predicted Zn-ribbon and HTH transcriptional regulator
MAPHSTPRPNVRGATVRQSLREALLAGDATARDLSRLVGIPERDVAEHIRHLERSVRRSGGRVVVEPSICFSCGFAFTPREHHRYTRPGRCPECHSRRISLPTFRIERNGGGT